MNVHFFNWDSVGSGRAMVVLPSQICLVDGLWMGCLITHILIMKPFALLKVLLSGSGIASLRGTSALRLL